MTIWSGNWWSELYPSTIAKGTVLVELPEDIESINDTVISFELTFTGMYRKGYVEIIRSRCKYKNGHVETYFNYGEGKISCNVVVENEELKGTYNSTEPLDNGSVELRKGKSELTKGCTAMGGSKCVMQ